MEQAWAVGACRPRELPLWLRERPEHTPGHMLMVPWGKMLPGGTRGDGVQWLQFNQGGPHRGGSPSENRIHCIGFLQH